MIELKDKLRAMIFCKTYVKKVSEQIEALKNQRNHVQLPPPVYKPLGRQMPYEYNRYHLMEEMPLSAQAYIIRIVIACIIMILSLLGIAAGSFLIYRKFAASPSTQNLVYFGASLLCFAIGYIIFQGIRFILFEKSNIARISKIRKNNQLYYREQKRLSAVNSKIQEKNREIEKRNDLIRKQNNQIDDNYRNQHQNAVAAIDQKIAFLERNRRQAENTLEKIRVQLNMNPEYAKNDVDLLLLYDQVKYANSYGNNFGRLQTEYKNIIKPQTEMRNYLAAISNIGTQVLQKLDEFNGYISKLNDIVESGFRTTNEGMTEFQSFFNQKFTALDTEVHRLHNNT